MKPARESRGKGRVHEAVAFDAALASEGLRDDIDPEMSFAAFPPAGMAGMKMGFVHDINRLRGQFPAKRFVYPVS